MVQNAEDEVKPSRGLVDVSSGASAACSYGTSLLTRNTGRLARRDRSVALAIRASTSGLSTGRRALALGPGRATVHTRPFTRFTIALFPYTFIVVGRFVPLAAHLIVDVLAVRTRFLRFAKARTEAELVVGYERCPFAQTFPLTTRIGEDQPTDRVPRTGSTVRIQFTAFVATLNVDLGQVACAGYLYKLGRLEEVRPTDRTIGNQTRTIALLETERDQDLHTQAE